VEDRDLKFYVVSDLVTETKGQLNVELRDLTGSKLLSMKKDVVVAPLQSRAYLAVPVSQFLTNRDPRNLMIYCELLSADGSVISSNEYFFEPAKNLLLPSAQLSVDVMKVRSGYKLTLTSDKLAKAVYVSTKTDGFFSDNYFDVLPDKPVQIEFRTKANVPVDEFRKQLKLRSLKDAFPATEPATTNKQM
jgi:beta-mannosidase